jgi:hypothetical protein
MAHHRTVAISLSFLALITLPAAAQLWDVDGNRLAPGTGTDDPPGTKLLEFKLKTRPQGLAVAGDSLYVMFRPNIYEIDRKTGAVKTTILLTGAPSGYSPFGLGFDLRRNAFIICDSSLYSIVLADLSGKVLNSVSVSPNRNVGAAYDSNRDGYWITSWSNNQLTLYDAGNLPKVIRTISLAAVGATRPAGTAFSAENDLVYTSSRDKKMGYAFDAATGKLLSSWPLVNRGTNNGQGAAWWDRWQSPVVTDYETFNVTFSDAGYPRVQAAETVKVGQNLAIGWVAANSAARSYQAAASFTERVAGFVFPPRYVPIAPDALFALSVLNPAIFASFAGVLDGNGTALGAVSIPNVPQLAGIPFSIAWVTVDAAAPFGILAISGPWKAKITS